ncbi:MAG: tRNA lysidine(34) synthetase TilS [Pseudomonadota bacterium]
MTSDALLVDDIDRFYGSQPPKRLGVAVSGGSDSLALLHLLHDWGRSTLFAVTVNHGLRPEAASEALHVERICTGLSIPHTIVEWQGWDGKGNLQDQARRTRYAMMADWGRDLGLDAIALGHTMDDQAETVLMRLARAAGVDGLSAMSHRMTRHGIRFDRPLMLHARRSALRDSLERRGVRWVDDPSNEDEAFDRIKARKALATLEPLGLTAETLSDVALHMRLTRQSLERITFDAAEDLTKSDAGDLIFDRAALRRQPDEIQRRLLAKGLQWVASADYPPRRDPMIEAEVAVSLGKNTALHGCRLLVSQMTVRITREHAAVAETRSPTSMPWDTRWTLTGPTDDALEIRALGEAVKNCPDWRNTGRPRATLLASPSVWQGEMLVSAPLAGLENGWAAQAPGKDDFLKSLVSH